MLHRRTLLSSIDQSLILPTRLACRAKLLHMPALLFKRTWREALLPTECACIESQFSRLFHNDDEMCSRARVVAKGQQTMVSQQDRWNLRVKLKLAYDIAY